MNEENKMMKNAEKLATGGGIAAIAQTTAILIVHALSVYIPDNIETETTVILASGIAGGICAMINFFKHLKKK